MRHTRPRLPPRKQALATCRLAGSFWVSLRKEVHATALLRLLVSCPTGRLSASSATAGLASPACPSAATGVDCSHGCVGGTQELRGTQPCCRDGTRRSHQPGLETNTQQSQTAVAGQLGEGQVGVSAPRPPCWSSLKLMEPDWSLSYCWKRFFHCWMKRSKAEKPYTSMRPDLVLSNMSGEERTNSRSRAVRSGARTCCRNSHRAQDLRCSSPAPCSSPESPPSPGL